MRLSDSLLETKIIQTACESKEFRSIILSQVEEDWFVSEAAREILRRIKSLMDSGKDIPSVSILCCDQSLTDSARALLSDAGNILQIENDVRSAVDLFRLHRNRKILADNLVLCLSKLDDIKNVPNVITTLDGVIQKCTDTGATQEEMKHHLFSDKAKLLAEAEDMLNKQDSDSIPSGFKDFDKITGGIRRKNVLVLASVPGGGKSSMALQMAIRQYIMGYNVCIVSYEMGIEEIEIRLYSNISKVNHSEINLKRLSAPKKKLILQRYGEWLDDSPYGNKLSIWTPNRELTIPQIALELKNKKYDAIYIDYLSLLHQNPKKQMWENLGEHTRAAKIAASSLNTAMVLLAQYDDESNRIKYAKAILANANFAWAWDYGDREKETGLIEVKQLKARNAPTYPFYLQTDYSVFTFDDYMGPAAPFENFRKEDEEEKTEIRRRKKKLDDKMLAQKVPQIDKEKDKSIVEKDKKEPTDKRSIPKMPQLF